jgi:signal peptidase I
MQKRTFSKKFLLLPPMIALLIFTAIKGALWLVVAMLIVLYGLVSIICKSRWYIFIYKRNWVCYPIIITLVLVSAICIRLFFFEIYYIPSESMRDTLYPGDRVLVEKISFGPRLPSNVFEIPWINVIFYFAWKAGLIKEVDHWSYQRLNGISTIKHNDLLVYTLDKYPGQSFIKRCVALPGDTFEIRKAKVYINGVEIAMPPMVRHYCRIVSHNGQLARKLADSLDFQVSQINEDDDKHLFAYLNRYQITLLESSPIIDRIEIEINRPDSDWVSSIWDPENPWTVDDFGPLIIPTKGMTIEINHENCLLYNSALDELMIQLIDNPGAPIKYTFVRDYYFTLGDHRHDSKDSRYVGFVSEIDIIGKAVFVLFNSKKIKQ